MNTYTDKLPDPDVIDANDTSDDSALIEKAIEIALSAHAGQTRWNGDPYILHPLVVMSKMETEAEQLVALLHDVVEGSEWTLDDLQAEGFPDEVIRSVGVLTRQAGMSYEQYIEHVAHNRLARRVKLADLRHNMDVRRLPVVTVDNMTRLEQYRQAWNRLLEDA